MTTIKTIDTALKSLACDGQLSIRINGECMLPIIQNSDLIDVQRQRFYWPGDILVKRCSNGQLIAHRFIGCFPWRGRLNYVTCADNASAADGAVYTEQIIGRVSGGECTQAAWSVPVSRRIRATGQFTFFVIQRAASLIRRNLKKA